MPTPGERLLHYVFPVTCALCGEDLPADDYYRLCMDCLGGIKPVSGLVCLTCGLPLPDGGAHCYDCRKGRKHAFTFVRSAAVYEGRLRELIRKFKYQGRDYLHRTLGALLVDVVKTNEALQSSEMIVPVPLHWMKRMLRGFNQSELLALHISEYLGKPMVRALKRTRPTRSQFRLSREERAKNIDGCFSICEKNDCRQKRVLVVDDVCTTGATLDECARILLDAGAKQVYGLTVARD